MSKKLLLFSIYLLLLATVLNACGSAENKQSTALVQVNDKVLYAEDLVGLVPKGVSAQDSVLIVEQYLQNWARKQLLLQNSANWQIDENEIDRKVEQYRQTLIIHEMQKQYVAQKMAKDLDEKEVKTFYKQYQENFRLAFPIVKGVFIKFNNSANIPLDSLENLLAKKENLKSVQQICEKNKLENKLSTQWVALQDLTQNTVFTQKPLPTLIQGINKSTDSSAVYLLKIYEWHNAQEIAPLEYVREQIIEMLLTQRKAALVKEMEDNIYKEAQKNNKVKFFNKK